LCGLAAKTCTTRASVVSVPARMSIGSVHSQQPQRVDADHRNQSLS
jgi:hypothetical protein